MDSCEPDIQAIVNEKPNSTTDERQQLEKELRDHLVSVEFPQLYEQIAEKMDMLQQKLNAVDTACRGRPAPSLPGNMHHDSTDSSQDQRQSDGGSNGSQTDNHGPQATPEGQQQDVNTQQRMDKIEDTLSRVLSFLENSGRNDGGHANSFSSNTSSGNTPHSHGASPSSNGTGNASRAPHFPTNPQSFGSNAPGFNPSFNTGFNYGYNTGFNNRSNPGGNTRFNTGYNPRTNMFNGNNGFNQSNPMADNQRTSREDLEMDIRMAQAKSSFLTSAMTALKPFSGEACDYATFMAQFDSLVHNNSFADVQIKQTILTNLLPPALAREHQTTEISEEKYQMIRHNLERQFNRHYSQFNLMRKDIERITFPANNLEKLQSSLNTYSTAPEHTLEDQSFIRRNGFDCEGVTNLQDFDGQRIDMILGNNVLNKVKDIQKANLVYLPSRRAIEHLLIGFVHHPPILDDSFVPIDKNKPLSISDDTKEIWINTISIEDVTTVPADEDNPNNVSSRKLDKQLERLWTLDVLGLSPPTVKDSKEALNADLISEFKKSAIMDKDNKIYVTLPFNGRQTELRNNFPVAKRRLQSLLERQLAKPEDRKEYHDIITKQLEEGIVEQIPLSSKSDGPEYFIPHRVVVKEDSLTTKLRIVLDASSHMKNELSLNDCLHPGPSILQSILGIMIRSRLSKFLLMSDIKRAFHQVRIQEQFRDVTKFLWLEDPSKGYTEDNLKAFRFTRLPFGVSSSPFLLAVTILRYLEVNDHSLNERIKENLYVDNVILTSNDEEDIKECYKQSKAIFNLMHMNLRDYLSNSPLVVSAVAECDRHPDHVCKLLGHQWDSISDTINIKIARPPKGVPTKKQIVAFSARNYDPSGIITPIIVPVKQLISSMWSRNINWKEKIPEDLVPAWNAIKEQFTDTTYSIPRQLTTNYDFSTAQLVIFSDASKAHYATTAYIRYGYKDDTYTSGLIFSKSRIRPSNGGPEYTIPRMELMALEIGSNAAVNLAKELHMDLKDVVLFSDSTCCLFWVLSKVNNNFGSTWVSNRVQKIHKNLLELQQLKLEPTVRYVPSDQNPADIASKGCSLKELKDNKLWHYGPEFLRQPESCWPKKLDNTSADPYEFRKQAKEAGAVSELSTAELVVQTVVNKVSASVPQHAIPYERTNSIEKLTIWITKALQWICHLIQRRNQRHKDKPIQFKDKLLRQFAEAFEAGETLVERTLARALIVKCHYQDAVERFNKQIPKRLYPILHEDGSWRHQTRFSKAEDTRLTEEMKFPIIIVTNHPLAKLIVHESHEKLKHQGVQDVISDVHQRYWIEHLGRIVKTVRSQCFICQRKHGRPFKFNFNRILPKSRTTFAGPFKFIGLDYLGPLPYKRQDGNGKFWILLVACVFTRAVHLEVVPDNTTISFINGLRRFISRRGVPISILSDNAPLFKLAYSIINEDLKTVVAKSEELTSYLASKQIKIKLITPLSPWQGGAYERLVGLVKNTIQKVLSKEVRSFLEMETLVIETEGIINSRPVTPNKRAEDDAPAIRPCDFINPGVQLALPERVDSVFGEIKPGETEKLTRKILEGLGKAKEELWNQFALSYFQTLRELEENRAAHSATIPKPGMVVLVESTKTKSRLHWPLGRIVSVTRSMDGVPRSVLVKCGKHTLEKAVNQLIPLEDPEEDRDEYKLSVPQPSTTSYPMVLPPQQDTESLQNPPAPSTSQPDKQVQPKRKRGRPPKHKATSTAPQPSPSASYTSTTPKESQRALANTGHRVLSTPKPAAASRLREFLPRSAKASTQAQVQMDLADDDGRSTFLQNVDPPPPGVSRP
ncbi:hypothetical protein CAEBREN_32772 [Caenorhabditis brenneri]|uniref:Integrase catalytic domain-containing protein n=1 Tax=Caenorhabditis brenneri TaxID=135651 RepID=G0MM97_CAEBE|nr:hypothetical protein CAEBREN_32772 [Caenorhabditis brenneri]